MEEILDWKSRCGAHTDSRCPPGHKTYQYNIMLGSGRSRRSINVHNVLGIGYVAFMLLNVQIFYVLVLGHTYYSLLPVQIQNNFKAVDPVDSRMGCSPCHGSGC
jgi:hypothetical protein